VWTEGRKEEVVQKQKTRDKVIKTGREEENWEGRK
jgi:hypothetical protein